MRQLRLALVLAGMFAACAGPPKPSLDVVAYSLSPIETQSGEINALRVEMRFRGETNGSTNVRLPAVFAGQGDLQQYVSNITASGGEVRIGDRPANIVITAPPSAPIVLSYLVHSGLDHPPTDRDEQPYKPWIFGNWFFLNGATVFARLERSDQRASFAWRGNGLRFASDLEFMATDGKPEAWKVRDSVLIGGRDVRLLNGGSMRLALRGQFIFADAELLNAASAILATERRFWGDPTDARYLVALSEIEASPGVLGATAGSQHAGGFAATASGSTPLMRVLAMFAHEIFHTWNPRQTGDDVPVWFAEGVTDYYGRKLLLRSGLISQGDFAELWNGALIDYATSSARAVPQPEIETNRFATPDIDRMSYLRGSLMAAVWDARLRAASSGRRSLDDVMHHQRLLAGQPGAGKAMALFAEAARASGLDPEPELARIDRGEPIQLPADAFSPCFIVETLAIPVFDRGFDAEASQKAGMVAAGVQPDGPAYAAGLRDGMKLVERLGGTLGDSTKDFVWRVQEPDGAEQILRWKPAGKGTVEVQRLTPFAGAPPDPKSCNQP